ncbi:MAG: FkbM family methyltransferase [Candidatus Sericytochromatia bacterium]
MRQSECQALDLLGTPCQFWLPDDLASARALKKQFQNPAYVYEAPMLALLGYLLKDWDGSAAAPVVLDIGAFIGYYTVYAAKLLGKRGQVWAFETNARYAEVLAANLRLNQVEAEICLQGLSDQVEVLKVIGSAMSAQSEAPGTPLPAEPLDDFCLRQGLLPNVILLDVHGFEAKILKGMSALLKGPLQYLLLELHPNLFLEEFTPGLSAWDILDQLDAAGFYTYYFAGHRYPWTDGMARFFEQEKWAYLQLTPENRKYLLFDRYNQLFLFSSKLPIEEIIGLPVADPALE